MPCYQHRYDFLCQHFNQNATLVRHGFEPTCLFDAYYCDNGDRDTRENTRLYSFSLPKLARYVATRLVETELFRRAIKPIKASPNLIRLGWYTPRGSVRFPVLLGIILREGDMHAIVNYLLMRNKPTLMLLPSIEAVPDDTLTEMQHKGLFLVSLQQLAHEDGLIDSANVAKVYQAFNKTQPDACPQQQCETFPTPSGARWEDIKIAFTDNHTVRVSCNVNGVNVPYTYNYISMGMNDKRTSVPNYQWALLQGFAEENGQFTWYNPRADEKQRAHRYRLEATLKKFFGLNDSPFKSVHDDKGRVGYQALFTVLSA